MGSSHDGPNCIQYLQQAPVKYNYLVTITNESPYRKFEQKTGRQAESCVTVFCVTHNLNAEQASKLPDIPPA